MQPALTHANSSWFLQCYNEMKITMYTGEKTDESGSVVAIFPVTIISNTSVVIRRCKITVSIFTMLNLPARLSSLSLRPIFYIIILYWSFRDIFPLLDPAPFCRCFKNEPRCWLLFLHDVLSPYNTIHVYIMSDYRPKWRQHFIQPIHRSLECAQQLNIGSTTS